MTKQLDEILNTMSLNTQLLLFGIALLFLIAGLLFVLRCLFNAMKPEPRYIVFPTSTTAVNPFVKRLEKQQAEVSEEIPGD